MPDITPDDLAQLRNNLRPLIGVQLDLLRIPRDALGGFEPSQIGTIIGTLVDASIPQLEHILPDHDALGNLGLTRHDGTIGEREGYPDFLHGSGKRLELKLLYVDPVDVQMKTAPTPREPSARLTQKVTVKNVDPARDALLVGAYQLQPSRADPDLFSPTIIDIKVFSMIECIRARDKRLESSGGMWFGDYETPVILSAVGEEKRARGVPLDTSSYGRKADEGKDFNEDTNFGKLKRIPYKPLQEFLKRHGASYAKTGEYPEPWRINP